MHCTLWPPYYPVEIKIFLIFELKPENVDPYIKLNINRVKAEWKAEMKRGDDEYEMQMFEWIGKTMKRRKREDQNWVQKTICL